MYTVQTWAAKYCSVMASMVLPSAMIPKSPKSPMLPKSPVIDARALGSRIGHVQIGLVISTFIIGLFLCSSAPLYLQGGR